MKNFGSEVGFTVDLQDRVWGQAIFFFFNFQEGAGDLFEIREHIQNNSVLKRKPQIVHKPHLKPKTSHFENDLKSKDALLMDEECRARLGELERQENLMGELDSKPEAGSHMERKKIISQMRLWAPLLRKVFTRRYHSARSKAGSRE